MTRWSPIASIRRPLAGMVVLALACALAASQAGAEPVASGAAANTMIGSIANSTPPDTPYVKYVKIDGQVQSPSPKFAPRKCRVSRTIDVRIPTVGGRIAEGGSTYPTNKTGHFRIELPVEYAGTDSDGTFIDGYVTESGGTVTFILTTGKLKVQKVKGDPFRTYTCRPLLLTLQITVPPVPGG
jgi:hypothetical protein